MGHLPRHIAIIMDGNGRWAKERHLPRTRGHMEGVKRVEEIVFEASNLGIEVLTLYAFSTENWNRPKEEISMLMRTFVSVLKRKIRQLHKQNIKVQFIGKKENISKVLLKTMQESEDLTRSNSGLVLNIAFNYGGRLEIVDAVKKIAADVKDNRITLDQISEDMVSESLYTRALPDPDFLIRTSGERRISNFLLWQLSYAELYFTNTYWPDFGKKEFRQSIADFKRRERRYGQVAPPKG